MISSTASGSAGLLAVFGFKFMAFAAFESAWAAAGVLGRDLQAVELLGHGTADQVAEQERAADGVADDSAGYVGPNGRRQRVGGLQLVGFARNAGEAENEIVGRAGIAAVGDIEFIGILGHGIGQFINHAEPVGPALIGR